ncbi:imidazole glycerol phosphate synthase subunit HisH [Candidatus Entotheonella serta]|nr:imidazole glycerol phosphate synthase subunit HisH [Candidatus Entotheonella serta]
MIAIVDYKAGNLTSVQLAFDALGAKSEITSDPRVIERAERVVFPGVGAARASMDNVREMLLFDAITNVITAGKPFLGICVGMQILFDHSEEDGGVDCMGILPGQVRRFTSSDPLCKIPHMGWNTVRFTRSHPLLDGVEDESEFYFVHSYFASADATAHIVGETHYADATFTSIAARDNLLATQFHLERSGRIGLKIMENFSKWDGQC